MALSSIKNKHINHFDFFRFSLSLSFSILKFLYLCEFFISISSVNQEFLFSTSFSSLRHHIPETSFSLSLAHSNVSIKILMAQSKFRQDVFNFLECNILLFYCFCCCAISIALFGCAVINPFNFCTNSTATSHGMTIVLISLNFVLILL